MSEHCCAHNTHSKPDTNAPSTAIAASQLDPMTAHVLSAVQDLAEGNRVSREDVRVTATHSERHDLDVTLTATGYYRHRRHDTLKGRQQVSNARQVGGPGDLKPAAREAYQAMRSNPDFDTKVRALVERDPLRALAGGQREEALYTNVATLYFQDRHTACRGKGETDCTHCHDGKRACLCVTGYIQVTRQGYNGPETVYERCGYCLGSGRYGQCRICNGERKLPCHGCAQSGWITEVHTTEVGVALQAHLAPSTDAPAAFQRHFDGLDAEVIAKDADLAYRSPEGGGGKWTFRFDARAPYCQTDIRAGDIASFRIEAAGKRVTFVDPPAFLDELVEPARQKAVDAGDPESCFQAARETRLTRELLEMCAQRGGNDASAFVKARHGCVSRSLVTQVAGALDRQYDRAGRTAALRTWWITLPAMTLAALAITLSGLMQFLFGPASPHYTNGELAIAGGLGLGCLIWAIGFFASSMRGRSAVRSLLGEQAVRTPRQPSAVTVLLPIVVLAAVLGVGSKLYTGPEALADTTTTTPLEKLKILVGTMDPPESALSTGASGPTPSDWISINPRSSDIVNDPSIYVLQHRLSGLGHYNGPLDGLIGPKTRAAITRFHEANPDLSTTQDIRTVLNQAAQRIREIRTQ